MKNVCLKFQYELGSIVFFTLYKGAKVELLRAKLGTADFQEVRRLRRLALIELQDFNQRRYEATRKAA